MSQCISHHLALCSPPGTGSTLPIFYFSHTHQPATQGCCSEPWPQHPSLWSLLGWELRQRLRLSQEAGCREMCWVMTGGNLPDKAAGGLKSEVLFPKRLQVDKAEVQEDAVSREMGFTFRKGTATRREEWPRSWAGGWEEHYLKLYTPTLGSCFCGVSSGRSRSLPGPQFSRWQYEGPELDQWFSDTGGVRKGYFSTTQLPLHNTMLSYSAISVVADCQHRHHLQACENCRLSGPTSGLLNQRLS